MSNRSIIILEGSEYVGKTSVGHILQKLIPNHVYIKLSQPLNLTGRERVESLLNTFTQAVKLCESVNNNVILDRFTTSERVYGPLYHGFSKDIYWRFDHLERKLSNLGAHHFILCAQEEDFLERWKAKTIAFPNEQHICPIEAIKVQENYLLALHELKYDKGHTHLLDTTKQTPELVAKTVIELSQLNYLLESGVTTNAP